MFKKDEENNKRWLLPTLIVLLLIVLAAIVFVAYKSGGFDRQTAQADTSASQDDYVTEKWQEGIINYKGTDYKYNNQIDTYLLMGIDKSGKVEQTTDYTDGGQSDAIFLLIIDKANEEFSVISVNRNTMTEIEQYNEEGTYVGTEIAQLCLQHAFGDGKRLSCRRTANAVANLFDNLPIEGYLSLQLDAIPVINDDIGGVTVEVLQDLDYPMQGISLTKGETVTLSGNEAYYYLRGRDINDFDSATDRLRREEQYISCFMDQVKNLPDRTSTLKKVYDDCEDYIVTNVDFVDMLNNFSQYSLEEDHIYTVPGETTMGEGGFEEFHVDDDALYDLIIQVFYNKVEE